MPPPSERMQRRHWPAGPALQRKPLSRIHVLAQGRLAIERLPYNVAMGLNIKNDEPCALIRELSHLTGESMTRAVSVAVRERLEREQKRRRRASAAEMLEIGARIRARLEEREPLDHADLLYDESGQFR
jgi:antitoxin VapB